MARVITVVSKSESFAWVFPGTYLVHVAHSEIASKRKQNLHVVHAN